MPKMIDRKEEKMNKQQRQQNEVAASFKNQDNLQSPLSKNHLFNPQQLYALMSPLPIPPKIQQMDTGNYTNNPSNYHGDNTDLRIIQTPLVCNYLNFRSTCVQYINDDLRDISARIDWQGTPGRSSPQNSDSQQQSSSIQAQEKIQQQEDDQIINTSQSHSRQQHQQVLSIKKHQQIKNQFKKRINKKNHQLKQIPLPNNINGENKKVTCNCKKTKCLKLYCDCFRINQTCEGCNCMGCHNLQEYAGQRSNAILVLMDRNPDPFSLKIQADKHTKGCNCKKSNCLKKYCQCYQAGLRCGENCKCQQCKNNNDKEQSDNQRKLFMSNNDQKKQITNN